VSTWTPSWSPRRSGLTRARDTPSFWRCDTQRSVRTHPLIGSGWLSTRSGRCRSPIIVNLADVYWPKPPVHAHTKSTPSRVPGADEPLQDRSYRRKHLSKSTDAQNRPRTGRVGPTPAATWYTLAVATPPPPFRRHPIRSCLAWTVVIALILLCCTAGFLTAYEPSVFGRLIHKWF